MLNYDNTSVPRNTDNPMAVMTSPSCRCDHVTTTFNVIGQSSLSTAECVYMTQIPNHVICVARYSILSSVDEMRKASIKR